MAKSPSRAIQMGRESIPRRYQWATFDAAELSKRVAARHVDAARAVVTCETVTLFGPPGSGKTVLACCLLAPYLAEDGRSGLFAYASAVAKQHHRAPGEAKLLRAAFDVPVLVLDGVGNEPFSSVDSVVSELLHERALEERITFLTTDLDRPRVAKRYGETMAFRMFSKYVDLT